MNLPPSQTRRGFLRGTLLTGAAAALAPGLIAEGIVEPDSTLAVVSDVEPDVPRHIVERIVPELVARINTYRAVTGEMPKMLLVNRVELRALSIALPPQGRWVERKMMDRGFPNLMLKNVPVASVDNDTLYSTGPVPS